MKVLLTGATGAAGLGILRVLLSDNGVSHVTYLGRRPLPPWVVLPGGTSATDKSPTHPKLSTIEHKDLLTYPPALKEKLGEHDACIWALGITSVGISEEQYTEITVGYFDALLNGLKEMGVGTAESPFRVVFISGMGADSKETSRVLFERVKGRAENNLIKAAEESGGHLEATVLRPGYFFPSKAYPQDALNQRDFKLRVADKLLATPLSLFYPAAIISVEQIGQFSLEAARGKWVGKGGPIFENSGMKKLLKTLNVSNRSREEL
jgi:nucleoside-diphosphate-sugar epimerase